MFMLQFRVHVLVENAGGLSRLLSDCSVRRIWCQISARRKRECLGFMCSKRPPPSRVASQQTGGNG